MKKILTIITAMALMQPLFAQDFDFNECVVLPETTTFRLLAPETAKGVKVRIYQDGVGGKPIRTLKMKYANGLWTATMKHKKGPLYGKFYTFDVTGDRKQWNETPGVFAKAVGVNGRRAAIIDMRSTDPEGWSRDVRPVLKSPADQVIYELHHRDFSIARNINLNPGKVFVKRASTEYPGKFLALSEPWAINHLKELGVNAVHILPSFDYASVDESRLDTPQYNWGYDPLNYNVPEGGYSTDPFTPATRIREFKQMVQALHRAGIRVILDVVYNHTYSIDGSNFQKTWPDYYFRKTADGQYSNGSGCGNETASERAMMRRFMIESVKYWINEYHIDGFRFDLMGVHDIETMNAIRAAVDVIDPTIFIYGEGWSAGSCAYPQEQLAMKAHISQMPRIAAFSDELRDALRGPFSDDTKGAFLAGIPGEEESVKFGIAGGIRHPQVDIKKVNYADEFWATEPTQMISYVSCHDDMCLVDRLHASIPDITQDELQRLDLLAQTAVFTSQGVPFMLSGEEMLRDKKGVHNSFESPDTINQLNWNNTIFYADAFNYYKKLIQLRKNHPAFRLGDAQKVRESLEFLPTQSCVVGYRLKNHAGGDTWEDIIVILNGNREAKTVEIPDGAYQVVCCDGVIDERGLGVMEGGHVEVDPQSALILRK
ncbi:MAG: type I pullulanase [Prevotella sp.]|nr:type I pullulanase [Prevotella sp.]